MILDSNSNKLNIFQRLSKITDGLGYVSKNLQVGSGNMSYKAVSENDILAAVKPLEKQYGVYSYPVEREMLNQNLLQWEEDFIDKYNFKDENNKSVPTIIKKQKRLHTVRIKTTYRFVNVDDTKDFVDMVSFADGLDSGDKGAGKAMTYADKYALMKAYKIATGEDPDGTHSNNYQNQQQTLVVDEIKKLLNNDVTKTNAILNHYNIKSLNQLDPMQEQQVYTKLKKG